MRITAQKTADGRGFSLLELLIVLAVVGLLAGLVLAVGPGVRERAEIARADGELAVLAQALERYRAVHGDYPWIRPTVGHLDLYAAVTGMRDPRGRSFPEVDGVRKRRHFVDLARFTVGSLDEAAIVETQPLFVGGELASLDTGYSRHFFIDPWGSPYVYLYRTGPEDGWERAGYLLLSLGPSGGEARERGEVQPHGIPPSGIVPPDYFEGAFSHDNILVP